MHQVPLPRSCPRRPGPEPRAVAELRGADAAHARERDLASRPRLDRDVPRLSLVRTGRPGPAPRPAGRIPVTAMLRRSPRHAALAGIVCAGLLGVAAADNLERNFAGSVQLDYMAVPTENVAR